MGMLIAMHAMTAAKPAGASHFVAVATGGIGSPAVRLRLLPNHAPTMPPPTAVMKPRIAAWGHSVDGHGSTAHTCDQPHSAASPAVPTTAPAAAPNRQDLRVPTARATSSTRAASAR